MVIVLLFLPLSVFPTRRFEICAVCQRESALKPGMKFTVREQKAIEIKERDGALLIRLKVQPKASADAIVGEHGGALKIKVAAAPENGKANRAVVEFIAEKLGLKKSDVSIVSGGHSRDKLIAVRGLKREELLGLL